MSETVTEEVPPVVAPRARTRTRTPVKNQGNTEDPLDNNPIIGGMDGIKDDLAEKPKGKKTAKHKEEEPKEKKTNPEERQPGETELAFIIRTIQLKKGSKTVMMGTQLPLFNLVDTGAFTLDLALLGGFAEGLCAMLYGWENSGKTTMLLRIVAALQRKHPDKVVAWLDCETTLDRTWAEKHGVDLERLIIVQPECGEDAVDILRALLDTEEVCGLILDSIPAMVPQKQEERSAADNTPPAELARLCGFMCSNILQSWTKERKRGHYVSVFFANQFRSKITLFGDPRSLPGGNQLKFLVSTRVEMKNHESKLSERKEKDGEQVAEKRTMDNAAINEHAFNITKAKLTSIRQGEFQMVVDPAHPMGMGTFLDAPTVVTYAKKLGIISGSGKSWRVNDLECFEGIKFGNLEEICETLYEEQAGFMELKRHVIGCVREEKGMPYLPPDGYLLRW